MDRTLSHQECGKSLDVKETNLDVNTGTKKVRLREGIFKDEQEQTEESSITFKVCRYGGA